MLRTAVEQPFDGIETVNQALGVVEAIDADDELLARDTVTQTSCLASPRRTGRSDSDDPRIDADRKAPGAHAGPVGVHSPVIADPSAGFPLDIVATSLHVLLCLKPDEIIGKQL